MCRVGFVQLAMNKQNKMQIFGIGISVYQFRTKRAAVTVVLCLKNALKHVLDIKIHLEINVTCLLSTGAVLHPLV